MSLVEARAHVIARPTRPYGDAMDLTRRALCERRTSATFKRMPREPPFSVRAADTVTTATCSPEVPTDLAWCETSLSQDEVSALHYLDYSYWNELSAGSYVVRDAVARHDHRLGSRHRRAIRALGRPSTSNRPRSGRRLRPRTHTGDRRDRDRPLRDLRTPSIGMSLVCCRYMLGLPGIRFRSRA